MNRNLIFVLILIIGLILQVTLFSLYTPWGVEPDLLLVLVVTLAILEGPKTGLLLGIIGGMLQDIFLGDFISINTIIKAPIGFLTGFMEDHFFKGNYFLAPLITFLASIVYNFLTVVLSEELIFRVDYWITFKEIILPSSIYNAILALIMYFMFYRLFYYGERYYGK